jgi:hypothetical protein
MPVDNQRDLRKSAVHRHGTPPPPIVAYEDVMAACGHAEKFGLFEDRKDRFRKDRRKKVTDRPCKACRERKRLEEEEATRVRKAQKQDRAGKAVMKQSQKKPAVGNRGRLPDGSRFEAVYNAPQTQWVGMLTVGEAVFKGSAGGVFKLLNRLDEQYRKSLPPCSPKRP